MINNLIDLSMRLYDVYSGITLRVEADSVYVYVDTDKQIELWVIDGDIHPELIHDKNELSALDIGLVLDILNVVDTWNKGE